MDLTLSNQVPSQSVVKSEGEEEQTSCSLEGNIEELQGNVFSSLGTSHEIVVIAPDGSVEALQSIDEADINDVNAIEGEPPLKKVLIKEKDQTYIFALQASSENLEENDEFKEIDSSLELKEKQSTSTAMHEHNVNQAWFTTREDKTYLQNKGHLWKQGMWSKVEIEKLQENIREYCDERNISDPATIIFDMTKDERKDFYRCIAKGLKRPLFSVYRRVIRMYDNKNHVGKYTQEELDKLKRLRRLYGNDWQAIGNSLGRSAASIKDRCRLMRDNCNEGKWLPAEERRLAEAVYELSSALPGEMVSSGLSWTSVADRVGTRSEKQCRTKWLNYLNWKEAGGTDWTREDDVALICRVYALNATDENGIDWKKLSLDWSSVRSPQWLRGKWWSLKRHIPNANELPFPDVCDLLYKMNVHKVCLNEDGTGTLESKALAEEIQGILHKTAHVNAKVVSTASGFVASSSKSTVSSSRISIPGTGASAMLQTLEVLPQAFLLTQPTIPLSGISPKHIIIQAVSADGLSQSENIAVTLNQQPQIIISTSEAELGTVDSISTEICGNDVTLMAEEVEAFDNQVIAHSEIIEVGELVEDIGAEQIMHSGKEVVMLSDPMLTGVHSPEIISTSDIENDRHQSDDNLDSGS